MRLITLFLVLVVFYDGRAQTPLFRSVDSKLSEINFRNDITENAVLNITKYDYLYNGAGIGVGDFNKDGLQDIFFAGNMVSDHLYFNKGNLKFEDVSASAGIIKNGWSTGVCIIDINNDGYDDIYVLRSGPKEFDGVKSNVLYLNQKDGTFIDAAENFGLNLIGNYTQAAPLDIDLDGDLDLYLMGHPGEFIHKVDFQTTIENIRTGNVPSDLLLENVNGNFIDITKEAGIMEYGYGLGLAISDINLDGFPDILVCNDFDEPDHVFVNQQNNTFLDKNLECFKHTSNYSMGNDIGDINNDGLLDYISVDMAFESHERSKTNMTSMNPQKFNARVQVGWNHQYMHNMLQLNTGLGYFQEIGQLAKIAKTDWSWAPLFMDMDEDGFQDLFISNGYKRDTKNNDIGYRLDSLKEKSGSVNIEEFLQLIPSVKIENFLFKNNGDLTFKDQRSNWGVNEKLNTNGAAYADLDNDGDLDLILNNMDTLASIYENLSNHESWSLLIEFEDMLDADFLGYKFRAINRIGVQSKEAYFIRGYCSSVEKGIYFYTPKGIDFESLEIEKPDGTIWVKRNFKHHEKIKLTSKFEGFELIDKKEDESNVLLSDVTVDFKLQIAYVENKFDDFKKETLLPHQMSGNGPFIDVTDIDNDGLEDFIISGAANSLCNVYLQRSTGTFTSKFSTPFYTHQLSEDAGVLFFDVNNDEKKDLMITSGGYQFEPGDSLLENRLYIGNGIGLFGLVKNALPQEFLNSGKIVIADFDADGDADLLICGPADPNNYPHPGITKIYVNENGFFKDRTSLIAPELEKIGMVNDAVFEDIDSDGDLDILVVGEWMNVEVFINNGGQFERKQDYFNLKGWWTSIVASDIDKDGDVDFVLGNAGLNNKFRPTYLKPIEIYSNDFDENGTMDIVLAKNSEGYQVPVRGKECSSGQMPFLLSKFPTFEEFANSDLEKIYGKEKLDSSLHLIANEFRSGILLNNGEKGFQFTPFSNEGQVSFLNSFEVADLNGDGRLDIIGVGNRFGTEVETTRYDAGCGVIYLQNEKGEFEYVSALKSGFYAPYDAKTIKKIHLGKTGQLGFLIGNNNQYLQLFKLQSN